MTQAVEIARKRRTAERRIKRIEVRITKANRVLKDLTIAKELKIERFRVPSEAPGGGRREALQARRIAAIGAPVQAVIQTFPKLVIELAFKAAQARSAEPPPPSRDPDLDVDR